MSYTDKLRVPKV